MEGGMYTELWLSHAEEMQPQRDLQDRIWAELRWEPEVAIADINVRVEDFVATLSGTAPSYCARLAVERAAERVPSIRSVINQVMIVLPAADARDDDVLAAAVANALWWDIRVPHVKLTERVVNGWVTLAGSVTRHCEWAAAEDVVAHLTGVRGITNLITIEPAQTPPDFRRLAEAAVARVAPPGSRISLETRDRTVALRGRVHTLADRFAAERAVWTVPGVAAVEDLLTVR
jgi:osmotically-inducible protein OsmY